MKKIICMLLCIVMLAGLVPTFASAAELPFTDVKTGWYYNAVKWCYEKGYMSGVSETTFEPGTPVSRAMFVTVLAKIDKADVKSYTGTSFTDVPEGKWYSKTIQWAYKNGYASGMGEGKFAPDANVTREQLAVFFYKYSVIKEFDAGAFADLSVFSDYKDVSGWARYAISWCVSIGLISGKGEGKLAPKDSATRAELAVMIKKFVENVVDAKPVSHTHKWDDGKVTLAPTFFENGVMTYTCALCGETRSEVIPKLTFTINGNDLSLYRIVYPAAAADSKDLKWLKNTANALADLINGMYSSNYYGSGEGIPLPDDILTPQISVVTDAAEPTDYEILVGRTNREDKGLVTVTFDKDASDISYAVSVQGTRLVIAGYVDSANRCGTQYGMYDFCEDALGFHFYNDETIVRDPVSVKLGADYKLVGGPALKDRVVYWAHGWDEVYCNDEYYVTANMVHGGFDCINDFYLEGSGKKVKVYAPRNSAQGYWSYEDQQLRFEKGDNSYTVYYDNGFVCAYNEETDNKVFLFVETETESGTVYVLSDALTAGSNYMIVSADSGEAFALKNDGGYAGSKNMAAEAVTIQSGDIDGDASPDQYVASADKTLVWNAVKSGKGVALYNRRGIIKNGKPCLSEEENIQIILEEAAKLMRKRTDATCIWLSQADLADGNCTCELCRAAYREDGTRGSTIFRVCNRAAKELKEEFPYIKIKTAAYQYSSTPPKETKLEENIIVYYAPIEACASHAYFDETCSINKTVKSELEGWSELCHELFSWDYSADFEYGLAPFPNLFVIRENTRWFYEHGVVGIFNNAVDSKVADFEALRSFLLTRLYRDPMMSEERYEELMDGFLAAYYGPGWQGIREYIDIIEENSEGQDFGFNRPVEVMYDLEKIADQADRINALWDRAEELAANEKQLDHIRLNRISTTYLVQTAIYDTAYVLGDAASREKYCATNDKLYEDIMSYGVAIGEGSKPNELNFHFNRETAPESWMK